MTEAKMSNNRVAADGLKILGVMQSLSTAAEHDR
jgi:hypothetical protein